MSFVAFTLGEVDADSPLTETFFTKMKDNFDALDAVDVTNGDLHDHSGGDGADISKASLKDAAGEISELISNSSTEEINTVLPGGTHGFMPRIRSLQASRLNFIGFSYDNNQTNGTFLPTSYTDVTGLIQNPSGDNVTVFMQQFYIQASPPYKIGKEEWGHFLFLLLDITTGEIKSAYEAEDPPWAYNGPSYNKKDSIERILAVPHPFKLYWDRDPAIDGFEIVLVDLRDHNTKLWKSNNSKKGKGILEDLGAINKKGKIIKPQELGIENIQGFTDRVKIRKA